MRSNQNKFKILGLDISSSAIGFGLIEVDGNSIKYISSGVIKPYKDTNIVKSLAKTRDMMTELFDKCQPDIIVIEDVIKFMKGKSSANTITKLVSFNRMICLLANDYLCELPKLLNVLTIRHAIKIGKKVPKKEEVPDILQNHLKYKTLIKTNKKDNLRPEVFDEADGIACAVAYYIKYIKKNDKKSLL